MGIRGIENEIIYRCFVLVAIQKKQSESKVEAGKGGSGHHISEVGKRKPMGISDLLCGQKIKF